MNLFGVFKRDLDGKAYRYEIDGLRFIAIIVVIIGHLMERVQRIWLPHMALAPSSVSWWLIQLLASPSTGVSLFFAISGFIIARPFQDRTPSQIDFAYMRRFYLRRILRICPPYYLILLATFVLIALVGFKPEGTVRFNAVGGSLGESLLVSLLFSHGWALNAMPALFAPGWTLEVEMQFYLLLPLLFLGLTSVPLKFRGWAYALLTILSFAICEIALNHIVNLGYIDILGFIESFVIGLLIARYEKPLLALGAHVRGVSATLLVLAGLTVFFLIANKAYPSGFWLGIMQILVQNIVVALIFVLALNPATWFGRFCRSRLISSIGMMCFSIYLTHLQVLQISTVFIAKKLPLNAPLIWLYAVFLIGLTFLVGAVFYVLVERPFAQHDWHLKLMKAIGFRGKKAYSEN